MTNCGSGTVIDGNIYNMDMTLYLTSYGTFGLPRFRCYLMHEEEAAGHAWNMSKRHSVTVGKSLDRGLDIFPRYDDICVMIPLHSLFWTCDQVP